MTNPEQGVKPAMSDEEQVKAKWPDAFARNHALHSWSPDMWVIYDQHDPAQRKPISVQYLAVEAAAWADAANRLEGA
jgi:hypothetical protein